MQWYLVRIHRHFNPLPPHGGRPRYSQSSCFGVKRFQSTPSAWRETSACEHDCTDYHISIHSLRMEGDVASVVGIAIRYLNFNPLPPHGGRPNTNYQHCPQNRFQSTPSAWRETSVTVPLSGTVPISIHSLRMEGDRCCQQRFFRTTYFNPLPPHGGRHRL